MYVLAKSLNPKTAVVFVPVRTDTVTGLLVTGFPGNGVFGYGTVGLSVTRVAAHRALAAGAVHGRLLAGGRPARGWRSGRPIVSWDYGQLDLPRRPAAVRAAVLAGYGVLVAFGPALPALC